MGWHALVLVGRPAARAREHPTRDSPVGFESLGLRIPVDVWFKRMRVTHVLSVPFEGPRVRGEDHIELVGGIVVFLS